MNLLGLQIAAVVIVAILSAGWIALKRHDAKVAEKTTATIVQRSEKQGARNATAAKKAHDSARQPGAAERLRKDPASCLDCK